MMGESLLKRVGMKLRYHSTISGRQYSSPELAIGLRRRWEEAPERSGWCGKDMEVNEDWLLENTEKVVNMEERVRVSRGSVCLKGLI